MDELQAALLRVRLRHLDEETGLRRQTAETYSAHISHKDIVTPQIFSDRKQVWHQYPIHSPRRDELREYLRKEGVATDIHYATPPHRQPCMATYDFGPLPLTEELADTELSLPIANLTPQDAIQIAEIINAFK